MGGMSQLWTAPPPEERVAPAPPRAPVLGREVPSPSGRGCQWGCWLSETEGGWSAGPSALGARGRTHPCRAGSGLPSSLTGSADCDVRLQSEGWRGGFLPGGSPGRGHCPLVEPSPLRAHGRRRLPCRVCMSLADTARPGQVMPRTCPSPTRRPAPAASGGFSIQTTCLVSRCRFS